MNMRDKRAWESWMAYHRQLFNQSGDNWELTVASWATILAAKGVDPQEARDASTAIALDGRPEYGGNALQPLYFAVQRARRERGDHRTIDTAERSCGQCGGSGMASVPRPPVGKGTIAVACVACEYGLTRMPDHVKRGMMRLDEYLSAWSHLVEREEAERAARRAAAGPVVLVVPAARRLADKFALPALEDRRADHG